MRLIDQLRSVRPQLIAEVFEAAETYWKEFEGLTKRNAARGYRYVILKPQDRTPVARAICGAVAVRAEAEGFKVERLSREADAMAAVLGAPDGV